MFRRVLLLVVILFSSLVVACFFAKIDGHAQTCGLRVTGAIANCQGASVLWSSSTSNVRGYYLQTYAGRFPSSGLLPAGTRSFLIPSGCGSGGAVRVVEELQSGATCTLDYTGNLPHARPCDQCGSNGGGNATTIVSSANFRGSVSRDSLASIFPDPGATFTDQQGFAPALPLPTTLAGVTVEIDGQLCGLVSVAPGQINFHLPAWLAEGPTEVLASINTTRGSVPRFVGRPQLNPSAPGVFTLSANGTGAAASNWLVVKPNGQQLYFAPGNLQFGQGDIVVLILYATGVNESQCELWLSNGQRLTGVYCGPSWMVGVQQMNFIVPAGQIWQGTIGAFVRVGVPGRSWDSQGFDLRR